MKIGIMTVKDAAYHPNARLREEADRKGHTLVMLNPYTLIPRIMQGHLSMTGPGWSGMPDLVLPRQGAQVGSSSLTVIRHLMGMGIPLVNSLDSILMARNKFLSLQALAQTGLPVPRTMFANDPATLAQAVELLGGYPVVAKQVSGRQGQGVFLAESGREMTREIMPLLDRTQGMLIQEFIAPEGRRDLRVMVAGSRVLGAMELFVRPGEFRSNYHLNHQVAAVDCSLELERTAMDASAALGLEISGVDLMIDRSGRTLIGEVNYSPGFQGLEAVTGLNIAGSILEHAIDVAVTVQPDRKTGSHT